MTWDINHISPIEHGGFDQFILACWRQGWDTNTIARAIARAYGEPFSGAIEAEVYNRLARIRSKQAAAA